MSRILIAEDELILRMSIKLMVEKKGHQVVGETSSGRETIETALSDMSIDIILLDISMETRYAGIVACKEIKDKRSNIKIIFISAYPITEIKNQLKEIPYDEYIEKPVSSHQLNLFLN